MVLIVVSGLVKSGLDSVKVHHRETYCEVVGRLLDFYVKCNSGSVVVPVSKVDSDSVVVDSVECSDSVKVGAGDLSLRSEDLL